MANQTRPTGRALVRAGKAAPHASVAPRRRGFKVELEEVHRRRSGVGYGQLAKDTARRYPPRPPESGRLARDGALERAAAGFNALAADQGADPPLLLDQPVARETSLPDAAFAPTSARVPGLRLVIGVEADSRAWVRVANALLDRIASGAVRAGSRVPRVTRLGLAASLPQGTAARAFRVLADEGVLRWVPGRGYFVRTRFTVPVSGRPRQDGRLTAVLPGEERQLAERVMPASFGAREG
jgi:hypothetical protein